MGIIAWIIFGGLAGWIASMIAKTNESMGLVANIVVGIVGAMIGGLIAGAFGGKGVTGFNISSFVVAIIGALVLLFALRAFRSRAHKA